MSKEEAKAGEEKTKSGKKKWMILLIIFVVIAISIVVMLKVVLPWMAKQNIDSSGIDNNGIISRPARISGPLDFTVNLSDSGSRRYLKVTMNLGYNDKALTKELEENKAEVRDLIIDVLRKRTTESLYKPEGSDELREELKSELNSILLKGEIEEIYLTDFLIQ